VYVIGCILEREGLFCASQLLSWEFRILAVCLIQEENRMEVRAGRLDIYTRLLAHSWFNLFCWLMIRKRPSLHHAEPPGTSWMRSLETRSGTRSEDSIRCRALLWHLVRLLAFRPQPSRIKRSSSSVSNGSRTSLRARVHDQTNPLPNYRSGMSVKLNCPLGYGSIVNSWPVWIGRVVSWSHSGSIYRFI